METNTNYYESPTICALYVSVENGIAQTSTEGAAGPNINPGASGDDDAF